MLDGEKVVPIASSPTRSSALLKWINRAAEAIIDLNKSYGPGVIMGAIRVLAIGPMIALRGIPDLEMPSILIEVPVGENVYGVAVSSRGRGILLDVAGYKTPELTPAIVAVATPDGDIVGDHTTDNYGNGQLFVPPESLTEARIIVVIFHGNAWESFSVDLPSASV
jgi:hypothetical protein